MNPDYIPGSTYRDAIELPGPTLMQRLLNHFSNWWGLWLVTSLTLIFVGGVIKACSNEEKMQINLKNNIHDNTMSFLKKNNITNISVINTWDGSFQVGSGCLGKDFATNITGEVDGKYLEATTCCSKDGQCKFHVYKLDK